MPTESEWEYACRAGTTTSRYWGDSVDSAYANYFGNGINRTVPVGQYPPNQWGFHDMLGNVWEWTLGAQGGYPSGSVIDPVDSTSGYANNRGNSWKQGVGYLRSAKRGLWTFPNHSTYPTSGMNEVGFRLSFRQLSLPPTNLNSTTVLTIAENQPTGTIVGEFNATDPEGGAITYHLVSGEGDGNNSLFTLDQNGKLKTAAVLDYEAGSRLSIRVQAKDELNATVEGNFTVTLLDVYEPSRENHTIDLNSTVDLEMIWVEPGTFTMGSPTTEAGRNTDETEHNVTLTNGFYLGKYEVTQAQYEAVMTGNTDGLNATPSNWPNNPDRPVEKVSWEDIQKFLTRLNEHQEAGNLPNGWAYVLPTEAQWEYACRAGTTTAYSWGDQITSEQCKLQWDGGIPERFQETRDVGQYSANPWGFFDMHGNVWEWTADWYAVYDSGAQTDPDGPATGSNRVLRGGSWDSTGTYLRSAYRNTNAPSNRLNHIGFRVGFQIQPDEASPELELFGGADIPHKRDEPWAEPGFGASDVRDGNLTSSVSISGTVDVNTTGTYTLTYTVSDAAGNEANATRIVRVADESADTDGDGFNDYLETSSGSDVNDAASTPFNYGLVAWYPFDGNASDMSGNGNHGTVNGATLGTDRHGVGGKAYSFDGSGNYIRINNPSESFVDEYTLSTWLLSRTGGGVVVSKYSFNTTTGNGFNLSLTDDQGSGEGLAGYTLVATNTANAEWSLQDHPNDNLTPSRYIHAVSVYRQGNASLYIDNTLRATQTYSHSGNALTNPYDILFGTYFENNGSAVVSNRTNDGFDGLVDDTRIYNRTLSSEEIELLYRAESPNHFVGSAKNLEMIWVEPGTFTMGQSDISNASPVHEVTLTQGFYLGKYEVTQAQYEAVMTGNTETNSSGHVISATPSNWHGNPDRPVERVSWEDVQVFLARLNEQQSDNLPNGWAYVLPTEAQWEYSLPGRHIHRVLVGG